MGKFGTTGISAKGHVRGELQASMGVSGNVHFDQGASVVDEAQLAKEGLTQRSTGTSSCDGTVYDV